jgi:putative hydrolase of the HAD superfamily
VQVLGKNVSAQPKVRAVLFDLGNTLVTYYSSGEFPSVLRRCVSECVAALGWSADAHRDEQLFDQAMRLNQERSDFAVRLLDDRLRELFGSSVALEQATLRRVTEAFLAPIFAMARPDPTAVAVLQSLRGIGIKTAVVSNTPWGSPADVWRTELMRHGLLPLVDTAVFCVDVGWRKPHRAPFDRALASLDVSADESLFVGDDQRWDVLGARNAGIRPVLLAADAHATPVDCVTIQSLGGILSLTSQPIR